MAHQRSTTRVGRFARASIAALAVSSAAIALAAAPANAAVIRGTSGPDVMTGTPHAERIVARAGDDFVSGEVGPTSSAAISATTTCAVRAA